MNPTDENEKEEDLSRFADWLCSLADRMKNDPQEFVECELEWTPDPINTWLHGRVSLDRAGYFVIKIQKLSHSPNKNAN